MAISEMTTYTSLTDHMDEGRGGKKIDKIFIHHAAGFYTMEEMADLFKTRAASAHYGVKEKEIGCFVDESNTAWHCYSDEYNPRSIGIELVNDQKAEGNWHVSDVTLETGIKLTADICRRNGIEKLVYTGDLSGNLCMHCWTRDTECPGGYLKGKFEYIAAEVNKLLGYEDVPEVKAKRIDVIVPAHRAHKTLGRTLGSLAEQTIADDLDVVVIDDACPEGDYRELAGRFSSRLNIRLIRLPRNLGPGGARQAGIDAGKAPYFTCIDADDVYSDPEVLEVLRDAMDENDSLQCCGGALVYLDDSCEPAGKKEVSISMDGKLYRRSFIERYDLRFNGTRANEDYGYNTVVELLCDNDDERMEHLPRDVVYVHMREDSITSANGRQFRWDQRLCGLIDNSIWAFETVKRYRPGSARVSVCILRVLLIAYTSWCLIEACAPFFAAQAWEYVKKYYHMAYRRWYIPAFRSMEEKLTPETTTQIFQTFTDYDYFRLPEGFEPCMRFDEFLERLRCEEYDPDHICEVWEKMAEIPELKECMDMNVKVGVCEPGYTGKTENNI